MGSSRGKKAGFALSPACWEDFFPPFSHPICFPVSLQPSLSAASPPLGPWDVEEPCRGPGGFAELCGLQEHPSTASDTQSLGNAGGMEQCLVLRERLLLPQGHDFPPSLRVRQGRTSRRHPGPAFLKGSWVFLFLAV